MAAIFVAEIGDVHPFPCRPPSVLVGGHDPLACTSPTPQSAGGTSPNKASTIVRWAAVEAVARYHGGDPIAPTYHRIAERRGKMIARVAAARKLLTLVFYGLQRRRDPLPGRGGRLSRLGHSHGASSTIVVAPDTRAWPSQLNEPAWLWPEHTMRTTREGMAGRRAPRSARPVLGQW